MNWLLASSDCIVSRSVDFEGMGSALEAIEVAGAAKGAKMRSVFTPPKQIWHDLL